MALSHSVRVYCIDSRFLLLGESWLRAAAQQDGWLQLSSIAQPTGTEFVRIMFRRIFSSQLRINIFSGVATTTVNTAVMAVAYPLYLL